MDNIQLTWRGFFYNHSGYAQASRGYVLGLDKLGIDIRIESVGGGMKKLNKKDYLKLTDLQKKPLDNHKKRILVLHNAPWGLDLENERRIYDYIIINIVFEPEPILNEWLPPLNAADAVWVPSTHNKDIFRNSGVKKPIYVIPHGVNLKTYNPVGDKISFSPGDEYFYFLTIAFWGSYRKAIRELLEVYWKEFSEKDKVCLLFKSGTAWFPNKEELINDIEKQKFKAVGSKKTAPVLVGLNNVTNEVMAKLYRSCHCYVLPSRGEGVGLPYMEAMACKKPCIATGWGGQTDFINDSNGFLLPYQLQQVDMKEPECRAYFRDYMRLAEPDKEQLANTMRYAYENREEVNQKGEKAYQDIKNWSWERSARNILEAVKEIISGS